MLKFLQGKRTYLVALAVAAVTVANYLGYLTQAQHDTILGLLGAGGLAALRSAK